MPITKHPVEYAIPKVTVRKNPKTFTIKVWVNGVRARRTRHGGMRMKFVSADDKYIVKLDIPVDGNEWYDHAAREVELWEEIITTKDREHFAPILRWGKDWLVQPYYTDFRQGQSSNPTMDELAEKYDIQDWFYGQWGRSGGKKIIVDYGMPPYNSREVRRSSREWKAAK